jgi:RNA polymerase-binding transcription factor DksA
MEISVARKRLEEMRDDLDRTVAVLRGEHPLTRGGAAEAGDAGANLTEADRNEAAVQAALEQRAEAMAALARVDNGSYGQCVDCGNEIPAPRLEARPITTRCVPCQSKRDRRRRLRLHGAGDQLGADRVIAVGAEFRRDQPAEAPGVAG